MLFLSLPPPSPFFFLVRLPSFLLAVVGSEREPQRQAEGTKTREGWLGDGGVWRREEDSNP
jgi:hypothetical protein